VVSVDAIAGFLFGPPETDIIRNATRMAPVPDEKSPTRNATSIAKSGNQQRGMTPEMLDSLLGDEFN
jgi:hypothetical protein